MSRGERGDPQIERDSTMMHTACLIAALLLAAPVLAAEEADEHAGHRPPAAAAAEGPVQGGRTDAAAQLQKNMQAMQGLMATIRASTDPAEKRRLLGTHMLAMEEQIKAIRALYAKSGGHDHAAGDRAKEDKDQDGAEGKQGGMMDEEKMGAAMMKNGMMMKKMHRQMEQRMDAVEQLLEQFIEHEAVEDAGDDD